MSKDLIAENQSAAAVFGVAAYTSVTIITHGGTGSFTVEGGVNSSSLVSLATPAADTATTISDNVMVIKVTPNTGGTYDVIGERR